MLIRRAPLPIGAVGPVQVGAVIEEDGAALEGESLPRRLDRHTKERSFIGVSHEAVGDLNHGSKSGGQGLLPFLDFLAVGDVDERQLVCRAAHGRPGRHAARGDLKPSFSSAARNDRHLEACAVFNVFQELPDRAGRCLVSEQHGKTLAQDLVLVLDFEIENGARALVYPEECAARGDLQEADTRSFQDFPNGPLGRGIGAIVPVHRPFRSHDPLALPVSMVSPLESRTSAREVKGKYAHGGRHPGCVPEATITSRGRSTRRRSRVPG